MRMHVCVCKYVYAYIRMYVCLFVYYKHTNIYNNFFFVVIQGLSNARINALEILEMPAAATMAAKEDLRDAESSVTQRQDAKARNTKLGSFSFFVF